MPLIRCSELAICDAVIEILLLSTAEAKAASAAALRREERFEEARKSRQVSRLDQDLARSRESRYHSLAAQKAAKVSTFCGLLDRVRHLGFPCDEMSRVDHVRLT